jgi:hypothetical protein
LEKCAGQREECADSASHNNPNQPYPQDFLMGKDVGITVGRTTSQTHEDYDKQDQHRNKNLRPTSVHIRFVKQRNGCFLYQLNISHWYINHLNIDGEPSTSQYLSLKKDSQQQ